jgi:hypothetical protein
VPSTDRALDAFVDRVIDAADSLAKQVKKDRGAAQDASFWEFSYGLIYISIQQLGHDMDRDERLPEEARSRLIDIVGNRMLAKSIEHRTRIRSSDSRFSALFNAHHEALGLRANYYLPMRTFAEGSEGLGGTLMWEIPKQAIRSAGTDDFNLSELLMSSTTFPMAVVNLRIPSFVTLLISEVHQQMSQRRR